VGRQAAIGFRKAKGYLLNKSVMDYDDTLYPRDDADRLDWRASPLRAGFDPLVDEGESYALRLAQAGNIVTLKRSSGANPRVLDARRVNPAGHGGGRGHRDSHGPLALSSRLRVGGLFRLRRRPDRLQNNIPFVLQMPSEQPGQAIAIAVA